MAAGRIRLVFVAVLLVVLGPSWSGVNGWWSDGGRFGRNGPGLPQDVNGGTDCAACTFIVSMSEQLSEIHNTTVVSGLEKICSFLPGNFKDTCDKFVEVATPILMEMAFDDYITPDVACHLLNYCYTDAGQPECHLLPLPPTGVGRVVEKVRRRLPPSYKTGRRLDADPCSDLPIFKELCEMIEKRFGEDHRPAVDLDQDNFSIVKTLRGSYWRGKDCNDFIADFHPGVKPVAKDEVADSDCNGISGMDPQNNRPYEETLCEHTPHMGIAILGDSAGAHFHLPKEWFTAAEIGLKAFFNLPMIIENEIDWPMTSAVTGYMNSTWSVESGPTDSMYLRLRELNHCNHRDFQNIAVNGGAADNTISNQHALSRDQSRDHPLLVIYSLVGNDVCNGHPDTINHMTTTEEMRVNFVSTLKFLDTKLPKGSHVVVTSLADGRVLYDTLKNRYHPLGEWRQNIKYPVLYDYLSCLQVSPCNGWLTSNDSLRNFTSERAANLSRVLERESAAYKAMNYDIHYIKFDFPRIIKIWEARGGQAWQLIEPVDGFHPGQKAMPLEAEVLWDEMKRAMPDVVKKWSNPDNARIRAIFGDQGGY